LEVCHIRKFVCLAAFCAVFLAAAVLGSVPSRPASGDSVVLSTPALIIDPGHGGEDGGANGCNGIIEKDINLAIALKFDSMMKLFFVPSTMTRTEDISLHDASCDTLSQKKVSDLHNRLAMIEELGNPPFVSIHQNIYPSASEKGAQVFYSPNHEESRELALIIQQSIKKNADPNNKRIVKRAYDDIFLMKNLIGPGVIVECGFISNPNEAFRLCDNDYQNKMAASITAATLEYLSKSEDY
jgi:N-acetylmuramoyl-L-alanine amidase